MSHASNARNTIVGWLWVGVPFGYGVYELLVKIPALFAN
ncbi:MFS transporter small subunit [Mycobacterium shigaense]|uniref:Uncharacterized protein n=1 Tax=Mycobacterium shigaense TaxID=722731 RepID=A0A1Z4EER1_9MYCO|nr:hypothetical protein MSG_01307 [Mycobacterium shigaense]